MDSQPNNTSVTKGEIRFPNDNRAVFVRASAKDDPAEIIKALEIRKPATVLLLIGGADDLDAKLNNQIESLLDEGLALAASDTNALIIDGGTRAGVMALMGKVIALRGRVTPLLGIAPAGKVTYPGGPEEGSISGGAALDPNHSHFVLVEGSEWSDGNDGMFKLVSELAKESRVVVVLLNGGDETRSEVTSAAKLGWPILVIQGSGRLANKVADEVTFADEGDFRVFSLSGKPEDLRQTIISHAEGSLNEAWRRFAQYDSTANANQATHRRLLSITLAIGVFGTLFALSQTQFTVERRTSDFILWSAIGLGATPLIVMVAVWRLKVLRPKSNLTLVVCLVIAIAMSVTLLSLAARLGPTLFLTYAVRVFKVLAIAVPVVVSVLVTVAGRLQNRRKWIVARRGAEAIKKEIFLYRTRVGDYADKDEAAADAVDIDEGAADSDKTASNPHESRDIVLMNKLVATSQDLMQTEVNTASLLYENSKPPADAVAKADDGYRFLTPEAYIEVRLDDQLSFFRKSTAKFNRQRLEFQILILVAGGVGTLLAALGAQLWIALTTAIVTALTSWASHLKLDLTLVKYNQTAANLSDLRIWWNTLPAAQRTKDNREKLIDGTEKILAEEQAVWVQRMEESIKENIGTKEGKDTNQK